MQPAAIQRVKPPARSLALSLCQGQLVRRCAAPPQLLTALHKTSYIYCITAWDWDWAADTFIQDTGQKDAKSFLQSGHPKCSAVLVWAKTNV